MMSKSKMLYISMFARGVSWVSPVDDCLFIYKAFLNATQEQTNIKLRQDGGDGQDGGENQSGS